MQTSFGVHATWEDGAPRWLYVLDDWGPWALGALVLALIARALLHHRRYRALTVFDERAQHAVHEALIAAERKTVGEIVPVVLERSDRHPGAEWSSALAFLLVGSALCEGILPWSAPHWLLVCQLGLGAVGFGLARALPAWKRMFVSERRATEMAEEQATQEFHRLGLHDTHGRTGVLLFASLFERRVVVLGDIGIHAKVGDETWEATKDAILDGVRRGAAAAGFVEAVRRSGSVLEMHFPWVLGDRNEIPDRIVVRRE